MNRPLPGATRDVALLLARLLLGTIMFAHGYQKLMIDGLGRTTEGFESMSIPVAIFSAAFVTVVEVVGGVLVVLGALIPVVAACYLVVMVGAAVFVHIPNGIFVASGGWELVGVIAAVLLALAAAGSGRYGVDHRRARPAGAPGRGRRVVGGHDDLPALRPADQPGRPLGARDGVRRAVARRRARGASPAFRAAVGALVRPGPSGLDGARRPRCDHAGDARLRAAPRHGRPVRHAAA